MRLKLLITLSIIGISIGSFAQNFKNEFGFKSDNDAYLFYGQDRYYTNGLFINFRHATDQQKLSSSLEKVTYEISAGQKMYNPISGYSPKMETQDRPFAGYLYAGANVNLFYKKESILKFGLELGTVGPNALGEDAQKLLHKIVGFYEIKGWEYQIKNEPTINLTTQFTKLLGRSEAYKSDLSLESYVNIGTTFSGAGIGILLRSGDINQLFNSAYTNSQISNNSKTERLVNNEYFFYAKPQLNFIAYDATIQGSMFNKDSPVTFETKPLVFAQQLGLNYSTPRFTFDFGLTFKSKEVKSTAKAHQYGSISMYYRFN
ncbi:MAG: lipid A deacylase LpxR family protein [Sphingobacteriaceae bacterium]|nr:lipid A deacylase LpxR family protein [Sphingobacteriaceae bacterium]